MIRKPIARRWQVGLAGLSVALMLLAYAALSARQHSINPRDTTIPGYGAMVTSVREALTPNHRSDEVWLWEDSKATGSRLALGLLGGCLGAIVLGLAMGCDRRVEAFFSPPLTLLAKVPPTAAMAVFFVMVGTDTKMFVSMIVFGVLPVMAQSVYLAVRDVPDELLYKAYTLGASDFEVVTGIVIPYVAPKVLDSLRLQIGPAMVYLIAAEMLVGDVGFGYRIRIQQRLLNMSLVYPYLAILAAFGFGMDVLLTRMNRWLNPWAVEA